MNFKNIYIVVVIKENKKYYSYVVKTTDNTSLLGVLNIKGIISANIWNKKKAYEVSEHWNECYKKNGTYLFDSPLF